MQNRENFKAALERLLKARFGGKAASLAVELGCSPAKVYSWLGDDVEGRKQPSPTDAVVLAVLDADSVVQVPNGLPATASLDTEQRAVKWLQLCGYGDSTTINEINSNKFIKETIERRTLLQRKVDAQVAELERDAEQKLPEGTDFLRALSCDLAQRSFGQQVDQWLRQSNGVGESAFFWVWTPPHSEDCLHSKAMLEFLQRLIDPPAELRNLWPGEQSKLQVKGFLQIDNSSGNKSLAKKNIIKSVNSLINDKLALNAEGRQRIQCYWTEARLDHLADLWALYSACGQRAALVSRPNDEVDKMRQCTDPEISSNPFRWSGQMIFLPWGKGQLLETYKVSIKNNSFCPKKVWQPIQIQRPVGPKAR